MMFIYDDGHDFIWNLLHRVIKKSYWSKSWLSCSPVSFFSPFLCLVTIQRFAYTNAKQTSFVNPDKSQEIKRSMVFYTAYCVCLAVRASCDHGCWLCELITCGSHVSSSSLLRHCYALLTTDPGIKGSYGYLDLVRLCHYWPSGILSLFLFSKRWTASGRRLDNSC